jgi:hypothetical protein
VQHCGVCGAVALLNGAPTLALPFGFPFGLADVRCLSGEWCELVICCSVCVYFGEYFNAFVPYVML